MLKYCTILMSLRRPRQLEQIRAGARRPNHSHKVTDNRRVSSTFLFVNKRQKAHLQLEFGYKFGLINYRRLFEEE